MKDMGGTQLFCALTGINVPTVLALVALLYWG